MVVEPATYRLASLDRAMAMEFFMSGELLVRGFWGPRAEDDGELAERLGAFLGRLSGLCPGGLEGWMLSDGDRLTGDDQVWLAEYVHRKAERGRREDPGLGIVEALGGISHSGGRFRVTASAGLTSSVAALQNSVVVELSPPRGAEEAEWRTVARHVLAALVKVWNPDWGDVAACELWNAVEGLMKPRERAPETGYAIYLSAARWAAARQAAVPDTWREELPGGGGVLSPAAEEGEVWPSAGQVVALDRALDAAGALGMTPVDAPRFGDPPVRGSGYIAVAGTRTEPDMKLSLKYRPVAVNAQLLADDIVAAAREISGVELDYSPASLREVDGGSRRGAQG